MFGNLNKEEIEELIEHELVCRIGCNADGMMYVVPVSYAYDGVYIYAHSFEGRKVDMMRKNPKVCFEIDDTKDLANWKSVIAWGEFEELKSEADRSKALQILQNRVVPFITSQTMHISPLWPFSIDNAEKTIGIVFRVKLVEKTGRYEKSADDFYYAT